MLSFLWIVHNHTVQRRGSWIRRGGPFCSNTQRRTCARGGPSQAVSPPEIYWDREIVEDMTPEQLSVMYGPYSNHRGRVPSLEVGDDGVVRVEA